LTQIDPASADLPVDEQDHQPLAFLSGAFKGASLRWSTTEKEAYAIVASCKRLDYLLQRPGGFTICTDHRNLRYIFGQEPELKQPRYLADKLARWAMILDTFTYDIHHIPGEANVWGDLLSRWGNPAVQTTLDAQVEGAAVWGDGQRRVMKRLVRLPLPTPSPLAADFQWPSWNRIKSDQRDHEREAQQLGSALVAGKDGVLRRDGRVWVPVGALELQLSLLVIAHAGAMGPRGMKATEQALKETFCWVGLQEDAAAFVGECLQCRCIDGEMVPRPIGEALHAVEPNVLIHCDFLSMPTGYIHVLVDDASGLCQLTWHDRCRADDMVAAMQQWSPCSGSSRTGCLIKALITRTK
jgi:hypothetical protein